MISGSVLVSNSVGLHARPAALLVKTASAYDSTIMISKDGHSASARSLLAILGLGVERGDEVIISADGTDEAEALSELVALVESAFGEE